MTNSRENSHINKCIALIEGTLCWGSSSMWSNYEFQKLSDAIHEKTEVRLSVTTLKRIWGRLKYENAPAIATLNVLARFAGYPDWLSFKLNGNNISEPLSAEQEQTQTVIPDSPKMLKLLVWAAAAVCLVFISYFFLGAVKKDNSLNPANFSFKANKMVGEGVPNSVIFEYNAKAAKTDSVYIVQTWDITRKTPVPKNETHHSAIYYYPGFFRTKLIADGQVIKTHDLQITSNGWLGLVETGDRPFYFRKTDIIKSDSIEVDEQLLAKNNFTLKPTAPKIRFFNQGDLGDLMNDNFVFETQVKNNYTGGNNACQYVEVLIQCKDDIIIIPLCAKTCVGDIRLIAAGKELQSKTADLSGFGADLTQWTTLKVEAVNKLMTFYVNGSKATSFIFPDSPTGIVGVQYRFNGLGAIRGTKFVSNGKVITL